MPNPVRHLLGVLFGVILTAFAWLALGWATFRLHTEYAAHFGLPLTGTILLAFLLVALVAAGLGLATAARFMSPIAALIPGVVFFVLSMTMLLLPGQTEFLSDLDPMSAGAATFGLSSQGVYPLLGLLLIVSAVPPHRWRGRTPVRGPQPEGAPAPPYDPPSG